MCLWSLSDFWATNLEIELRKVKLGDITVLILINVRHHNHDLTC